MAVGDVYVLVLKQHFGEQDLLTVWTYRSQNASTTAEQLALSFEDTMLPLINVLQGNDIGNDTIQVKNLFSETDFYELALTGAGGTSGDTFAPFIAYGLTMTRASTVTRNGAKRIPGVPESAAVDGVITDSATITALDALAAAMIETLKDVATGLIDYGLPIIVKRILVSDPDGDYYRFPENSGELQYSEVAGVDYNPNLTSQVSRKFGRGA